MPVKRIFRGPWFWIVLAVVSVLLMLQYLSAANGAQEVRTSTMEKYLTDGKVKTILFVDGDQTINATLTDGKKVTATWVQGTQRQWVNLAKQQQAKGELDSYNAKVAKPSLIGSLLFSHLSQRVSEAPPSPSARQSRSNCSRASFVGRRTATFPSSRATWRELSTALR